MPKFVLKGHSEGAFLHCAGSGCIVCALAWPWFSIIISPTGRSWFCTWSCLAWCLPDCMCASLWDSFPRVGKLCFLPGFYQLFGLYPKPLSSLADDFCFSTCRIHCLYPWMPSQLPAWWWLKEGGTTGEGGTKIQYLKCTTLPLPLQTYYGS